MKSKVNINVNYLGSKESLLNFIEESIKKDLKSNDKVFCDLFSGSGVVARHFRKKNYQVIANDIEAVSFLSLNVLLAQNKKNKFLFLGGIKNAFKWLNSVKPKEGFFTKNYCPLELEYQRKYFTIDNAMKIDAIRSRIQVWRNWKLISKTEKDYMLFCLVKAVEKVSNTAAIYEAYLKGFKSSARNNIKVIPIEINNNLVKATIYNKPAENLIKSIKGDILYLDPPYNRRQYSSNYHILNTLILNDNPMLKGKTGNRDDNFKSSWCMKTKAVSELEHLISNADFNKIYMSYNSEGIISTEKIKEIFSKHGQYKVFTKKYKRFKSNKNEGNKFVTEYLHCLIKE